MNYIKIATFKNLHCTLKKGPIVFKKKLLRKTASSVADEGISLRWNNKEKVRKMLPFASNGGN